MRPVRLRALRHQLLRSSRHQLPRALALSTAAVTASTALLATTAGSASATPPPTPKLGPAIEVDAPYQGQTICDPVAKPGVVKFRDLLLKTYPTTGDSGITRACSDGGKSEHKEGRAWDWRVNVNSSADVARVNEVGKWLFATDAYGNQHAMARRLGIMYIIWNKRIWNAGSSHWDPYSCSGTTDCHMDHMHFSFGWAGALAKTSYWTGVVSPVLPAPGQPAPKPTFPQQLRIDAHRASATTSGVTLTAGRRYLLTVSGTYHYGPGTKLADAECSRWDHSSTWRRWTSTEGAKVTRNELDLLVGGAGGLGEWTPTVDTGQGCNLATHTYSMVYTPTRTGPLSLLVNSRSAAAASGLLSVTIATA